ncbi:MAG: hypothetical protein ABSG86_19765 [Thermoguttaceae bacterium]
MTAFPWRCEPRQARLRTDAMTGLVAADRPGDGLSEVAVAGRAWPGARLLGIAAENLPGTAAAVVEWLGRQSDLVAAYEQSASRPFRIDAVWRSAAPGAAEPALAAVDLILSVRTENAGAELDVALESFVPFAVSEWVEPGCAWFRPTGLPWSYVETVQPADACLEEQSFIPEDGAMRLRRRLFPQSLERGVILRVRARGLFLPANLDAAAVAHCHAAFLSSPPPLDA